MDTAGKVLSTFHVIFLDVSIGQILGYFETYCMLRFHLEYRNLNLLWISTKFMCNPSFNWTSKPTGYVIIWRYILVGSSALSSSGNKWPELYRSLHIIRIRVPPQRKCLHSLPSPNIDAKQFPQDGAPTR